MVAVSQDKCPYAEHGICQIATRLGNAVAQLDPKACVACLKQPVPMSTNRVTASLACKARRLAGLEPDRDLSQIALGIYHLAGFRVERNIRKWLKRLRITPPVDCGCEGWVAKMNAWGGEGSLEHIDEITDALYENLKTTYLSDIAFSVITKPLIKNRLKAWLRKGD